MTAELHQKELRADAENIRHSLESQKSTSVGWKRLSAASSSL